jgi:hypothetical protein
MCFESLAGRYRGCEFGLVQRHYGIEPLGLLRWSNITPDNLAVALERRFEGVGSKQQTELRISTDGLNEYSTHDRRFGMAMHTFVTADKISWEPMYKQSLSRLTYLIPADRTVDSNVNRPDAERCDSPFPTR